MSMYGKLLAFLQWEQERDGLDQDFQSRIDLHVAHEMEKHELELANDRIGTTSEYNGVSRVNCSDGYVDVRACRSTPIHVRMPLNGSLFNCPVDACRVHFRAMGLGIYNFEVREKEGAAPETNAAPTSLGGNAT